MERPFYARRLRTKFGIEVRIPDKEDRETVHRVIYDELCRGVVRDASRGAYTRIMEDLEAKGARAIVLACTEIGLLVRGPDTRLPVYDTTLIHADAAVRWIVEEQPLV